MPSTCIRSNGIDPNLTTLRQLSLLIAANAQLDVRRRCKQNGAAESLSNLYGGMLGSTVAIAYIGSATESELVQATARRMVDSLELAIPSINSDPGLARGIGACFYGAAFSYKYCRPGTSSSQSIERCLEAIERFGDEPSIEVPPGDLMHGVAGLVVGLSRAAETFADGRLKSALTAFLVSLTGHVSLLSDGELVRQYGCGLAHGLSGVGFALCLGGIAGNNEDSCRQGLRCLQIESNLFDERLGDWPDSRYPEPHSSRAWCHGAIGIAFSRLALVPYGSVYLDLFERDITRGLRVATSPDIAPLQCVCCGNWGAVEFLRRASEILGEHALRRLALNQAALVIPMLGPAHTELDYGLFRGLSGIASAAAALAAEKPTPSIFAFEL